MESQPGLFLICSHHLFPVKFLKGHEKDFFLLAESYEKATRFRFHKHHLIFSLSTLRHYAKELKLHDFNVISLELSDTKGFSFEDILRDVLKESGLQRVITFEIEDKSTEQRLIAFCKAEKIPLEIKPNPQFMVRREEFRDFLQAHQKPQLKNFYTLQRQRWNILMETSGEPTGGRYTFDDETPLKWSQKSSAPKVPMILHDDIDRRVMRLIEEEFPDNPGDAQSFWYPTSRRTAFRVLKDFCYHRLPSFGPYEKAISTEEDFLFHSVLAPLLNVGLLLPADVIKYALLAAQETSVPLVSLESFIRQILGWREFTHGIYQNFSEQQESANFWNHHRRLNQNWQQGTTGIPPLDDAIHKALRIAYTHGAERTMILSNMMMLAEIDPQEAYEWFMSMHMDSIEWSTVPNVFGLGLYADGGLVVPEPNFFKSNEWLKSSSYDRAEWCDEVDGLYWRFVDKHRGFFEKNPRLHSIPKAFDHMSAHRRQQLLSAADAFLARNTTH